VPKAIPAKGVIVIVNPKLKSPGKEILTNTRERKFVRTSCDFSSNPRKISGKRYPANYP